MVRKSKSEDASTSAVGDIVAAATTTTRPKSAKVVNKVAKKDVVAESISADTATVDADADAEADDGKTVVAITNRQIVVAGFTALIESIESEIVLVQCSVEKDKNKRLRFLKHHLVKTKKLQVVTFRTLKQRPASSVNRNTNSGLRKPVSLSPDMIKFTGWDATEQRSRVDVTKFLCNYIKDNNLQNPSDRRQIVPDNRLGKLLDYKSVNGEPLTYFRMQSCLKNHFS